MNTQAQAGQAPQPHSMLNAVWYQVLKPKIMVLPNGQPAFDAVAQVETLAEATALVRQVPGGLIVLSCVVFVNPQTAPIIGKPS